MKINEFIKAVQERDGLDAEKEEYDYIDVYSTDDEDVIISIPLKAKNLLEINYVVDSFDEYLYPDDKKFLSALIEVFLKTPIKERFPEKKYRVRLRGFNSDGGHQYLTVSTRYSTNNLGSVFAAAWNTGLKQTFTADELNKIRERFKGSKWIVSMLNDGVEEVGECR